MSDRTQPLDSSAVLQTSPGVQSSYSTPATSKKRKKSDGIGDGHGDVSDPEDESRASGLRPHQPVKRACNECRQQKLRCDVVTEPQFQPCSRCIKHHLHCAIDPGFRRQEKRQQYAELEKELAALKAENAELRAGRLPPTRPGPHPYTAPKASAAAAAASAFPGPNEAAASRSLLDLAQGQNQSHEDSYTSNGNQPTANTLGPVVLSDVELSELFAIFFTRYHPYLPLLSTDISHSAYFNLHPLLHWTIITVASRRYDRRPTLLAELKQPVTDLLSETIFSAPQTYHVVKALCLLCTWPLPTNSTSLDLSMMICGTMVQLAMQFGLHRPSHAQDFSRYKIELREEDIKDRMNTWVACNIVAQNVSTGYGMPQVSRWNWYTHGLHLERIAPAFRNRCHIERFVDKITRTLYTMQRDLIVTVDEAHRALTIDMFGREFDELRFNVLASNPPPVDLLYLDIAALHFRLTAFFDSASATTYWSDLSALYVAASSLLNTFLALPPGLDMSATSPTHSATEAPASPFATNYIMQMVLAAGFALLKLLNSFFASQVDIVTGRTLFLQTVSALRNISVLRNDLPQRLAEVLAQLWQASGAGGHQRLFDDNGSLRKDADTSLQLKVRCRMSVSLIFDSVWRWKEQFGAVRNLDSMVEHPTEPDGLVAAGASAAGGGGGGSAIGTAVMVAPDASAGVSLVPDVDLGLDGWDSAFAGNAPFDSLGWALDGFLELPLGSGDGFV